MNRKNDSQKKHIPFASRLQLSVCVALCPLFIAIFAIMTSYTALHPVFAAIGLILLYLLLVALIAIHGAQYIKSASVASLQELLSENGSTVFKNTVSPVFVLDAYGTILWYNDAMRELTDPHGNFIGVNIGALLDKPISADNFADIPICLFDRLYTVEGFTVTERGEGLYLATLTDVTELSEIERKYVDERVAIAYISIDNAEDILQYVHEKFRDAISIVDNKIKEWAASMNGIIKSYDNDKYIMIFDSARLDECIANRFEILDRIRETRVGDSVSITASIGVSKVSGSLSDRENAARAAIDMALQRGGDQVVYKTEDSIEFYGGRTKSLYKRSSVRSRSFTNQLLALFARADNVIIMGHRYGDFDSFGASVGVAKLASLIGMKVNIAVDMRDENIQPCIELMQENEQYSQTFVDRAEGFDLIGPDTVVVIVDHNTTARSQFSDIASSVSNIVVIDHHRKSDAVPGNVALSYIEPSASSTCELVSEMLEVALTSQNLLKVEADMLLAGILLDTKQFTRNTGTRTFGAAQYLRGAGANPTDVYDLFKTPPQDLAKEARFHTAITVYRNNIAIASCDGDTDESYRIIASKAADKMLTLRDIEAAFTVVRIGEQIHISGRSNGRINVQLILEKLNGGGHFDIAGAQVKSESVTSVLETLKESIDDYLELVAQNAK